MNDFLELSWRLYPAVALIVGGGALFVRGLRAAWKAPSFGRDPERALAYARGFRIGILGLCAVAFGLGWIWGLDWLVIVSLIVLGEEMLETSLMIAALRASPGRTTPAGAEARREPAPG